MDISTAQLLLNPQVRARTVLNLVHYSGPFVVLAIGLFLGLILLLLEMFLSHYCNTNKGAEEQRSRMVD